MKKLAEEIRKEYSKNQEIVDGRIKEFKELRNASDERLFLELVFVILSSQSNAKKSWNAAKNLENNNLLYSSSKKKISKSISAFEIQQENRKATYIVNNRTKLSQPTLNNPDSSLKLKNKIYADNLEKSRKWFSQNIEGISWKGSSHFLRNTGFSDNFAIISKPILQILYKRNLVENVEPPKNFKEYKTLENKLLELSEEADLTLAKLDLILWSMKTGEVFK